MNAILDTPKRPCDPVIQQVSNPLEHNAIFHGNQPDDKRGQLSIHFRPLNVQDEQLLRDFFQSHTPETIYLRYGMMIHEMTHERALQLVKLDGHSQLALIGLVNSSEGEQIVAVGRYALDIHTQLAEVAFVVHESCREMGIAVHLLRSLVAVIHDKNFAGITAQVLTGNMQMLEVLNEVLGAADEIFSESGEMILRWYFNSVTSLIADDMLSDSRMA